MAVAEEAPAPKPEPFGDLEGKKCEDDDDLAVKAGDGEDEEKVTPSLFQQPQFLYITDPPDILEFP